MLSLTPAEKRCLLLRSRGLTNKEIAKTFGIAVITVERHFYNVAKKHEGLNGFALVAEFVREQCAEGVWE